METDLKLEDFEELISKSDSDFSSGGWRGCTLAKYHFRMCLRSFCGWLLFIIFWETRDLRRKVLKTYDLYNYITK